MQRLTIHLKETEKVGNKIYNTISRKVKNESEINYQLSRHERNVSKHYVSNF